MYPRTSSSRSTTTFPRLGLLLVALLLALLALTATTAGVASADADNLIITGVVDGPLTGGVPKAVELYVVNDIADLSIHGIGSANNGGGSDGEEFTFPAVSATAGTFIYVASESTGFTSFFGFAPDYTSGAASINGDDAIELFTNGSVTDTFGDINATSGSWLYTDGWAYRIDGTGPDGSTFTEPNWTFSGTNALDGETTNDTAATPFPIGTYNGGGSGGPGNCGDPATLIHTIQGSGITSPELGNSHIIEGVVVGDFQGASALRGFFVQEEDSDADMDPATSEGLFVFDGSSPAVDVAVGDVVRVQGFVSEFTDQTVAGDGTLTQLSAPTVVVCGTAATVTAAGAALPETTNGDLERYEGMLVTFSQPLTVAQTFFLGRYGQMTLSGSGRLYQPTHLFNPNTQLAQVNAQIDLIQRSILILDDGAAVDRCGDNPTPVPYLGGPPPAILRAGDTVSNLTGVLGYGQIDSGETGPCFLGSTRFTGDYRLHPTTPPTFTPANARTAAPDDVGGTLKVAAFNVLNYFVTLDLGPDICGPTGGQGCRGADSATELIRQRDKIVAALCAIDADIVGLMEIENPNPANDPNPADGVSNYVAKDLVDALNAPGSTCPDKTYTFVDSVAAGSDAIRVDFIYKSSTVAPDGAPAVLTDAAFTDPNNLGSPKNRPAVAQTFEQISTNEQFTAIVNHLKSKGSDCDGAPDDDPLQGNCNGTRTAAADYLVNTWLPTDPTGSGDPDFLILGDLNAYAQEDPITTITDAGYTELIRDELGTATYSFIFDGQSGYLDHALASPTLAAFVTGVTEWHINTDEPSVISYDEDFNPPGYYSPDVYRASDHDPVIVGLNLEEATAVSLASLSAEAIGANQVRITWETASETDHAGFNVWRSASAEFDPTTATQLNATLITAAGSFGQGAAYSWLDEAVPTGIWYYTLEDVSTSGAATRHEPVMIDLTQPTSTALTGAQGVSAESGLWLVLVVVAIGLLAVAVVERRVA